MILNNFVIPLLLTIIIESVAAFLMGYRGRRFFIILLLINTITNPVLNYILILLYCFRLQDIVPVTTVLLEVCVVLVEWRLLVYALQRGAGAMLLLSAVMNAVSYLSGLLIFR